MSFKRFLIFVYSVAGFVIALFTAIMTYVIIGEPIGMKMVSKITLVVMIAMPVIAFVSYGLGHFFSAKFERLRERLEKIGQGDFNSDEPEETIADIHRIHRAITVLSARLSESIGSLRRHNESVTNMTLSIAHDIKTPLTIIGGYVEELRDGMVSNDQMPAVLDKIKYESAYIDDLTSDVLAYLSSIHSGRDRERVSLNDLVDEIMPLIPITPDTRWIIDLPDNAMIEFNRMDLKKLLMNLLHNSAKFTVSGEIRIAFREGNIVINDTGCGIDPIFFPRLFEPYSTADTSRNRQKSGLGLGLSIAKNLAENNGYDLRFDETNEPGTTVILSTIEKQKISNI
ncbi:MAG: HAMP domain-containing sensor histidine kinase [Sulfuricurvum sp.]|nr:HAMP domain-containing sensor histidine kinase [Sulfuricurvum sp.]